MKGRNGQGLPAQQHIDDRLDRQVEEYSKLYSIEQWLQPRSMVEVQLAKLKEETRCPMCFGKIRSARISMACLHRYCAKCIEQYLRARLPGRHGDDKECPVCRAHLASRRATKPDPAFDKIIKALYGDVDQYDAEEEALIEADNKAHMKAWQEQLADMKARQAAAVAAAKAEGPVRAERKAGNIPRASSAVQLADEGGWEGAGGKSGKKRGYAAAQHLDRGAWDSDEEAEDEDEQKYRVAGGSSKGASKAARLAAGTSKGPSASSGRKSAFAAAAAAGGMEHSPGARDGGLHGHAGERNLVSMESGGLGGQQHKKKKKQGVSVARLIGLAAKSAAEQGPRQQCCVVHLVPEQQQEPAAAASPPEAAAGRAEGRSRKQAKPPASRKGKETKQPIQQLLPGHFTSPSIERPFLACPLACTVVQLKKMLQQQLQQQGMTAKIEGRYEVQLLPGQQQGLLAATAGSNDGSSEEVLDDGFTVGQLHAKSGSIGPDLQIVYRLVGLDSRT